MYLVAHFVRSSLSPLNSSEKTSSQPAHKAGVADPSAKTIEATQRTCLRTTAIINEILSVRLFGSAGTRSARPMRKDDGNGEAATWRTGAVWRARPPPFERRCSTCDRFGV